MTLCSTTASCFATRSAACSSASMALTVIETHGVTGIALVTRHGHDGRRIKPTGQQDDCFLLVHFAIPQRMTGFKLNGQAHRSR